MKLRTCGVVLAAAPVLGLLCLAPPVPARVSFGSPRTYRAGEFPDQVAVGDFNRDRDPDLAVTNGDDVSVLLGRAGGRFRRAIRFGVGIESPGTDGIAVSDFNADGDLDLAVANSGGLDNYVVVLLGLPGGGFGAATRYPVGEDPHSVAVGDFNADRDPDLAVADFNSASVSVLLGRPGGGFGSTRNFSAGNEEDGDTPISIAVADFNADRAPDLVVAQTDSDRVSVLLGRPGGTFGPARNFGVGGTPISLAVADFNGDRDPDVAVAHISDERTRSSEGVSVLLGRAGGRFRPAREIRRGKRASSVTVGDVDRDRDPDLVLTNNVGGRVSVLLGLRGSGFRGGGSFRAGNGPNSVAVGDFNGDRDADLAVAGSGSESGSGGVSVLLNTGHFCLGRPATLRAKPRSRRLRGTLAADVIFGSRMADVIKGRDGADRICGRNGRDRLSGGPGNDRLSGGPGNDRLSGGSGDDRLNGASGGDRVSGGPGDDRIDSAGTRRDLVDCGPGRDRVRADPFDRLRHCERAVIVGRGRLR